MGGVCWYGEIYWNANLWSYFVFKGSCQGPPTPSPHFSPPLHNSQSLQETGMGPSHHLNLIQVSVAFLSLDMSLGSAGALIEFVGYKAALRSYFLTSRFWIRQCSKGVMDQWPVDCLLCTVNFSVGPLLVWQPCFPSQSKQIDFVLIAFRPPLAFFKFFKFSCQKLIS